MLPNQSDPLNINYNFNKYWKLRNKNTWGKKWNGTAYNILTWKQFWRQFGLQFWLFMVHPCFLEGQVNIWRRAPKLRCICATDTSVTIFYSPLTVNTTTNFCGFQYSHSWPFFTCKIRAVSTEHRALPEDTNNLWSVWYGLLFIHIT